MAKKSRQARRAPAAAQPTPVAQPVRIARPIRPPAPEVVKEVDFSKEYHYVIEDLKRIGIIAASLLAVLVVVALIVG
jgi:hypothetical protein